MATKANLELNASARRNNVAEFPAPARSGATSGNYSPARSGLRRIITREQGRALETIGHAVDYLHDCYIHQGNDAEFLNVPGPPAAAIQILIAARQSLFHSLPLVAPWHRRLLNALLRRKPRLQSGPVVT